MDKKKYEKTRAFFFSTTQVTSSKKLDQRDPRKGKKSNFFVIANRTLFTSFFLFLFIYFLWSTLISSKSVVGLMKEEGMDGEKIPLFGLRERWWKEMRPNLFHSITYSCFSSSTIRVHMMESNFLNYKLSYWSYKLPIAFSYLILFFLSSSSSIFCIIFFNLLLLLL